MSAGHLPSTIGLLQVARHGCPPAALARGERGAIMIEAAIVFPLMIVMFLGLVEFGEAFAVNRRLTSAASTVSDLIAQVPKVSRPDLEDIARAAEEIIKPYATTNMAVIVSSIEADGDNVTKVGWSYAHGAGAAAHASGGAYALPTGLTAPNSSIIVAEAVYQFSPSVGLFLTGPIALSGRAFFRPRVSKNVVFDD